jgi:hypothetical protein
VSESRDISRLLEPKLIALDSSHLGAIAADRAATDRARRQRAEVFEKAVVDSGSVIVLSFHHLEELFSHHGDEVIALRIAYLQSLPIVAAVASFRNNDVVGTVADIQSFEIAIAFDKPSADVAAIRDEVAKSIFRLCSGADLVRPLLGCWGELRQHFVERKRRNGEIVAISRSKFAGTSEVKIVDLLSGKVRTPENVQQQFARMHLNLSTDIRERGDKRIQDPKLASLTFLESAKRLGLQAIAGDNPARRILELFGVDLSDIGPETTVGDVGEMAVFRRKLELLNGAIGLPFAELKARVTEARLPSGIISDAIARYHPDTREWDGSELVDRHLACLAAYADVTYVDKRTHEASRQAKKKSRAFASIVHCIEKVGEYSEIGTQLAASASPTVTP